MKRLLKEQLVPPSKVTYAEKKKKPDKISFTPEDLVDLLQQIEELQRYTIEARYEGVNLILKIGDSKYEISNQRYQRRRLRKLET